MDASGTRQSFKKAFIALAILYGIVMICAWICFALTLVFLDNTGTGYHGVLAAVGGMMAGLIGNYGNIARHVTTIQYRNMKANACSFYSAVCFVAGYPFLLIVVGLADIALASVFGIGYGDRVAEADQKNADANLAMGIINVVLGCFVVLVSVFAFHYGNMLKKEIDRAQYNEGAFASGPQDENGKI